VAKLIVKDRRLCIVNGRLVSDGDGAPCVCDTLPPVDPAGCFLLVTPCVTTDPARDVFLVSFQAFRESVWPLLATARVLDFGVIPGCYAVVGYILIGEDEPLPDIPFLFADFIGLLPDPSFYDSCLDSPCGVTQPRCENCLSPNRCVTKGGLARDAWEQYFGFNANQLTLCAVGALLVTRYTGRAVRNSERQVPSDSSFDTLVEVEHNITANSRTVFGVNANGRMAIIDQHSYSINGFIRRFGTRDGEVIEDTNETINDSQNLQSQFKNCALSNVSTSPFAIGGITRSIAGIEARYEPPPPSPPPSPSDRIRGWSGRLQSGSDSASWSWNLVEGCFRRNGSSSVSETATIQPLWGGATYSVRTRYQDDRRKDNSLGPGCPGVQQVIDTEDWSYDVTESRQVLWLKSGTALPDLRPGCPLTVLVVNCNDLSDRSAIDASGLVPLPGVAILERPSGPTCYVIMPIIVDEPVEVPIGFASACGSSPCSDSPPPGGGGSAEDDPVVRPRGVAGLTNDEILDAMGFDPEEELRRVRAGGCCGQPGA